MPHISGLQLIDAPASALNNAGEDPEARTDNSVAVKSIRAQNGARFPYVSAQAFRYWLRHTLESGAVDGWVAAPVFRETKVAYTDGNPLRYWDDDLFGYMRAPSKKASANKGRQADTSRANETPTTDAITRVSPFRVGTLVSIGPVNITRDFGTMTRHDGDPVPYEHQFYRTTLQGLFSLDLQSSGTFTYVNRSGFRNLDDVRIEEAKQVPGIEHLEAERAYRLPRDERARRIAALLDGLSQLDGGAKQAVHYTNVAPSMVLAVVTRGGNNPFAHVVHDDRQGSAVVDAEALASTLRALGGQIMSPLYVGWAPGYLAGQQEVVRQALEAAGVHVRIEHPSAALRQLSQDMAGQRGEAWLT